MQKFISTALATIGTASLLFLNTIFGTLIGAISAAVIGLVFGKVILQIFASIGIEGFTMWQIGAFLGFISGFFSHKSKD